MILFPKLNETDARELAEKINKASDSPEDVQRRFSRDHHEKQTYDAVGEEVSNAIVRELSDELLTISKGYGWPNTVTVGDKRAKLDADLGICLHKHLGQMGMTRHQASKRQFWHFLCTVAAPHVVCHRWPALGESALQDRYLGSVRNALGRLWWRVECLHSGDYETDRRLLYALGEDRLVQMQERGNSFMNREIATATAQLLMEASENGSEMTASQICANIRRLLAVTCLEWTDDVERNKSVLGTVLDT